ncbi:IMS-domain-containing protein [Lyophyllum atratum]|nr:IMS-domain-containing protein [Lyophyllum atratum]
MSNNAVEPVASQETETLVKRLAGPSTGKAGLAKDQTEINRIIAEASKGSKFYENEKKKDKDLTDRIEKILKQRDDALRGVTIGKIEQYADHLISELESERDFSQMIVHVDMDAFYANVELLDNPDLKGKPFGVGHGVLTTASYEARKYGVRSGMPGFIAKKLCPELIFVQNHFPRYMQLSDAVMSIFRRYDANLFSAGCDEAYLNITAYCEGHDLTAAECVQEMRKTVFEETRLTASAGIAPTKMLAKICSDKNKPNGQFELAFDKPSILSFLHDLPIRKIPGIGRVNERLLEAIGIKMCGDIFTHRATIYLMEKQFGRRHLFRIYLGITSNIVEPVSRGERKSIGAERTFTSLSDKEKILDKLDEIATELEKDMEQNGWTGQTVALKFKLDTYQVFTRAKSFERWITKKEDLYATGKELLLPELPLTIRLIGLRVTKLKDLRAPPEPEPANGIKRFFEPVHDAGPRKKARTDEIHTNPTDETQTLDDDSDLDETMPSFPDNDEDDFSFHEALDESIVTENIEPAVEHTVKSRPPVSAPRPSTRIPGLTNTEVMQHLASSSVSGSSDSRTIKPRSTSDAVQRTISRDTNPGESSKTSIETHDCPLCGKALRTDNQGFNSHIDFCLSRSAIRQAHAEASSPTKKNTIFGFKPISKGKAKGGK